MPWTRSGDNAATYPALMQLQGTKGADDRLLNEIFGFVWRCSCQSAAHLTDYVVDAGTAHMLGGSRAATLIRLCEKAGVFTPRTINGVRSWVLLQDPDFIHIQLRAEVDWSRTQRNDTRNTALTVPVRLRDGDNCRWCGVLVQWRGKKTGRSAELDHLRPGEPGTVDTMVVSCRTCNGARQNNVNAWADNHELRPAPGSPRYGKTTAAFLTDNGYPTTPNTSSDDAPAAPAADAQAAPTPGVRRAAPPSDQAPARNPAPEVPRESPPKSTSGSDERTSAGSGRDGSALGSSAVPPTWPSTPADLTHRQSPPPARRRRRGARGGRSRPAQQGES